MTEWLQQSVRCGGIRVADVVVTMSKLLPTIDLAELATVTGGGRVTVSTRAKNMKERRDAKTQVPFLLMSSR
jgi:hypothetical protein